MLIAPLFLWNYVNSMTFFVKNKNFRKFVYKIFLKGSGFYRLLPLLPKQHQTFIQMNIIIVSSSQSELKWKKKTTRMKFGAGLQLVWL